MDKTISLVVGLQRGAKAEQNFLALFRDDYVVINDYDKFFRVNSFTFLERLGTFNHSFPTVFTI